MRSLLSRSRFVCWLSMWVYVSFWVEANTLLFEIEEVRYLLSWNSFRLLIEYVGMRSLLSRSRFVCWLSVWVYVSFWVEANTFTVWDWGIALPSELKQIRLLIEYAGIRSLLSRIKFVWWFSMCGCVPFWVEAFSFTDWDWGDSLPFEWKQIRFLIEKWGCVSFWVETNSFTDWDWDFALPFELKQIRLLIEYAGMRSLLSRSRSVCWLNMWGCVSFWVEANTFTVWDWGDALPSELKQIRLLIEYAGMRSLLSRSRFVCWLSMWECVNFWVEANSFAYWVCGDAFPFV